MRAAHRFLPCQRVARGGLQHLFIPLHRLLAVAVHEISLRDYLQRGLRAATVLAFWLCFNLFVGASDWAQLQHDAARTGRGDEEVAPPYRARWLWFGSAGTLRNRLSKPDSPDWTDDLVSGVGKSYRMPAAVPMTFAGTMQPVVWKGKVFVASQEGTVFAIREDDGATLWESDLPGGCIATGAAQGNVVIFCSLRGAVHAYHIEDGKPAWIVPTGRSITGAPCMVDDRVYVASHGGCVAAIHADTGRAIWTSDRLGAPVQGGLAATRDSVYVGAEDLKVHRLNAADGRVVATRQVCGQSFRLLWPVIHKGRLWVRTAPVWCVGSEGVNDPLLSQAGNLEDEEMKCLAWLNGEAEFGSWSSKNDWKTYYALSLSDLTEPFQIPCGPSDGCGQPPQPPVVDHRGELISWWPTRYCGLMRRDGTFGTRYHIDLAEVNTETGRRQPLSGGEPVSVWPMETDNLYALSAAGRFCYWRQRFRGTYAMDLVQRRHYQIQVEVRSRDGGVWSAPIMYADTREDRLPRTPSTPMAGRVSASVANHRLYLCESYGVTAVEHADKGGM